MNVLDLPWAKREEKKEEATQPTYLGVRHERIRTARSEGDNIVVEVGAVSGVPSGRYDVAYSAGAKLGDYFYKIKMRRVASRAAVYDQSNLSKGRLRSSYIPGPSAHILIVPPSYSPMNKWRRRAESPTKSGGLRIEDIDMRYR